jgi:hypothetical protein
MLLSRRSCVGGLYAHARVQALEIRCVVDVSRESNLPNAAYLQRSSLEGLPESAARRRGLPQYRSAAQMAVEYPRARWNETLPAT